MAEENNNLLRIEVVITQEQDGQKLSHVRKEIEYPSMPNSMANIMTLDIDDLVNTVMSGYISALAEGKANREGVGDEFRNSRQMLSGLLSGVVNTALGRLIGTANTAIDTAQEEISERISSGLMR